MMNSPSITQELWTFDILSLSHVDNNSHYSVLTVQKPDPFFVNKQIVKYGLPRQYERNKPDPLQLILRALQLYTLFSKFFSLNT